MNNTNTLNVYSATTFLQRLRGLLGRSELNEYEALHIAPCREVHSFGMKYALDIIFLNDAGEIVKTGILKPNRWMKCKDAQSVIELKAGSAARHGLSVGQNANHFNEKSIGNRNEHN